MENKREDLIYGKNPIIEAISAGRTINKILIAKGSKNYQVLNLAKERKLVIQFVEKAHLTKLTNNKLHQGVLAFISPYKYFELEDILEYSKNKDEAPFIILLDEIQDSQNFGAILRTADATGVHGVLIQERRSVTLNEVVAKTSSGAVEYVRVSRVKNISSCINYLKEKNIFIFGLEKDGEIYTELDFSLPCCLVLGSEGKGLSYNVKRNCDFLVKIPMKGKINSLNASVAVSIIMYEVLRRRKVLNVAC